MNRPKLTYFDFPGGRGEDCRIALFAAGVDFEDDRVKGADWPGRKTSLPFQAVPTLELDGKVLSQSNAILTYVGRAYGLHPTDPWEAARHEAVMSAVEDARGRVGGTLALGEDEKKRQRAELASGYLQIWGASAEREIHGKYLSGDQLHVADLKLALFTRWFASGVLDHLPITVFESFPKIGAHLEAVKSHPKVAAWYAR